MSNPRGYKKSCDINAKKAEKQKRSEMKAAKQTYDKDGPQSQKFVLLEDL